MSTHKNCQIQVRLLALLQQRGGRYHQAAGSTVAALSSCPTAATARAGLCGLHPACAECDSTLTPIVKMRRH